MRVPQKDKRSYFIRERPMTTNINNSPEYACRTCAKQECGCKDTECQLPCHLWMYDDGTSHKFIEPVLSVKRKDFPDGWREVPLYTAPVRTKDLTDEEIDDVRDKTWCLNNSLREFARAVIAADRELNK